MSNWETIAQTEDFIIDYDKNTNVYRVSYFQDNHFVDDVTFDAYGNPTLQNYCELEQNEEYNISLLG